MSLSSSRILLPFLAALILLGLAGPAHAVTVDVGAKSLQVTAGDGEASDLLITSPAAGTYVVTERSPLATIRRGASTACTDDGLRAVRCTGVTIRLEIDTGAGDDRILIDPAITLAARIVDGAGNDVVTSAGGADTLVGSPGDDVLDGGAGTDRVDYSGRATPLAVTLDGVAGDGAAGERDNVLATVENVDGGSGADRLTGSDAVNHLKGSGGDDVLDGGLGADILEGGAGQDTADYRSRTAPVTVTAGAGGANDGALNERDDVRGDMDNVLGGSGDDVLTGNTWWGTIEGGAGDDTIDGGAGNDTLLGGPGADVLRGSSGADILDGGAGADDLDGGTDADVADYSRRTNAVTVDLRAGTGGEAGERDTIDDVEGASGGAGADRLLGDDEGGRFDAGPGDDVIDGRGGADRLAGGDGWDVVDYTTRRYGLSISVNDSADDAGERDDVRRDVEEVRGGSGDDRIVGDDDANVLDGGPGNDRLYGNGGNDRLELGDGHDDAWGGNGDDLLRGAGGDDELDGDAGNDTIEGDTGNDRLTGDSGDDHVHGGTGDDRLAGDAGNDRLYGAEGADQAWGGSGDDTVEAGDGNDKAYGEDGGDRIDGGTGADQLSGGSGADLVAGGPDADALNGDGGADRLDGGDANDHLSGGGDGDVLVGGAGADVLKGDGGEDTADYSARTQSLRITNDGKADDGERGEADNVDASVDNFIGGSGNDLIRSRDGSPHKMWGEGGNDTLDGGMGADHLSGGAGDDQLIGRGGRDAFDGGPGGDKLSGADNLAEILGCGPGKDSASRDRVDKAVSCEALRIGKPGASAPADPGAADVAPVPTAPARRVGVKRVYSGGRFVAIPGSPGERIDRRLLKDVAYLKARYKVAVTDGFAMSGHSPGGEHPRGVALDLVPGPGGSWSDIDRLARWAEPRQGRPRAPFRWVGYNGDRGHGRGHHLHLSWKHSGAPRGKPPRWVEVMSFAGGSPTVRVRDLQPLAAKTNRRLGGAPSVRSGLRSLPRCKGATQLRSTWKAAGSAFKINWKILAAITEIESGFGCNMGPSSAGAIGWTQFMPATWKAYGMDADGNGKASPYSSADAIFSSARYLRASGAPRSYRKALFAYNHATWYVNDVLRRARKYR